MSESKRTFPRVSRLVAEHPWAILPERLETILDVLDLHAAAGRPLTPEEIEARVGSPPPAPAVRNVEAVAVIPIMGVMAHRMNLMTAMSGGTSTDVLAQQFRTAQKDPDVKSILLDVDSPGGSVFGMQELADEIYAARGRKPVVAIANATAASAAYWIASQADQFVMTPSGMVGSIGVIATHVDRSKQADMLGVKHTFITAGKYKGEGADVEPLSDPARADMQSKVDAYYAAFVRAVARGRGVSAATVREGMGEGRTVTAKEAVAAGMVDGVATFDQTLSGMLSGRKKLGGIAAEMPWQEEIAAFRAQLEARIA